MQMQPAPDTATLAPHSLLQFSWPSQCPTKSVKALNVAYQKNTRNDSDKNVQVSRLLVSLLLLLVSVPLLRQRIHYKLVSFAFRALSGLAPDYFAGDCQLAGDSRLRSLRSAERRVCSVPRKNSTFGDRSFAAAGPRAWNELPFNLRDTALSLAVFNAHLKTHLFSISCGATAHL